MKLIYFPTLFLSILIQVKRICCLYKTDPSHVILLRLLSAEISGKNCPHDDPEYPPHSPAPLLRHKYCKAEKSVRKSPVRVVAPSGCLGSAAQKSAPYKTPALLPDISDRDLPSADRGTAPASALSGNNLGILRWSNKKIVPSYMS